MQKLKTMLAELAEGAGYALDYVELYAQVYTRTALAVAVAAGFLIGLLF